MLFLNTTIPPRASPSSVSIEWWEQQTNSRGTSVHNHVSLLMASFLPYLLNGTLSISNTQARVQTGSWQWRKACGNLQATDLAGWRSHTPEYPGENQSRVQRRRGWASCQGEDTDTQNSTAHEGIIHTPNHMASTKEGILHKKAGSTNTRLLRAHCQWSATYVGVISSMIKT